YFNNWFEIPSIKKFLFLSKKIVLPGFQGIPIYYIIRFIIEELEKDSLNTRANAMAFSFFLSLFPAIIFIFTLVPYFGVTNELSEYLNVSLQQLLPESGSTYLIGIINDITGIRREGLLSFGFLLAIYFSSSGILTMIIGFEKSHLEGHNKRSYYFNLALSLALTLVLFILIIASSILIILGNQITNFADMYFETNLYTTFFLSFFRYCIAFFLIYLVFSILYNYGSTQKKKIGFLNTGSLLSTILSILTSLLFAFFVDNFGRYNELYGSIGALIVVLLWLKFNCLVILLGYELNTSIMGNIYRLTSIKNKNV
ncbi:MAG TPA: YihY/virulence factor BrkB family protein, partial [Saprospiraceae bacterium]|nr:YihY/virulence factor BrkB family protein [Saprospiraceae bacterium]